MEMKLVQKEASVWIEEEPILKRQQLSAEAVIPDSREDAKCVVWSRGGLLLKGKEPASHGCSFTGEAWAVVLYLTESGKTDSLRISREFEMDVDTEETDEEALPQISWQLSALEGRLLNPRKLGLSFEIQAAVSCFRRGTLMLEAALPPDAPGTVHLLEDAREALLLRQIREKSFSVRDTIQLRQEEKAPRSIAGEGIRFAELDTERLGARCVVKGELELVVWGPDETGLPVSCVFRIPFSQLVDLGEESEGEILVQAEPSSLYLDWQEGMDGQRSLDAELHGVLQLRVYARQALRFVTDGYCNLMPSRPVRESRTLLCALERRSSLLSGEESFPMPEDMQTLLAAEPKLGPLEADREQTQLPVSVDLLIRRKDGSMDALHRSFRLQAPPLPAGAKPLRRELSAFEAKAENGKLLFSGQARLLWDREEKETLEVLSGLELDEDAARDCEKLPALSLVLTKGESFWELAKEYHSSVEAIAACNPEPDEMLMIPTESFDLQTE
jgi:hypothetical protein